MASTLSDSVTAAAPLEQALRIRGCRVHNLKNVNLDVPRDQLIVITGPSGSGKSSLAFDTIFAEGQRQYLESLSTYARQFLQQMERPDVDLIDGLQPTIAIDQRMLSANPRSTVGTVTEIYDYLRLLFARVGDPYCYRCGAPISQQSPEQVVDAILESPQGTKLMVLAPLVRGRKGQHEDVFAAIRKAGLVRARVDGVVYELDNVPPLARQKAHTIEAVVDRIIVRDNIRARLAESIDRALARSGSLVSTITLASGAGESDWQHRTFSTEYACPECQISYEELQPRTFSFNSPYGACDKCDGLGSRTAFDPELIIPDASLKLDENALAPWLTAQGTLDARRKKRLTALAEVGRFKVTATLNELKPKQRHTLWDGSGDVPGVLAWLERDYEAAATETAREHLETFRGQIPCAECGGARLRAEARSVRVGDKRIHELTALSIAATAEFFAALEFPAERRAIAAPLLREIRARLNFLLKVGLPYLTLERSADTLSGGELQRIRLATGIGSGLIGTCYVLDEPSIGLHPRDNQRLIEALRDLQQLGNTVIVVEHDEAVMRQADYLFDMGPGAGIHGGQIVAQGTPAEVLCNPDSLTGQYLSGACSIPLPSTRRVHDNEWQGVISSADAPRGKSSKRNSPFSEHAALQLLGARLHNLQGVELAIPLGAFTCVTGVSGSGKSSLLNETLARAVRRQLTGGGPKSGPFDRLLGLDAIDKFVEVDQSPIGRTPRSNPATYTGVFDEVRKAFAQTRDARLRGYSASRFSFNVEGGRCAECQGQGLRKIEMNFLPDLYVECPECHGARFNRATLDVRYRDKSIAEALALSVDAAAEFFENFPVIRRLLDSLREVGLGYVTLGQSCTTLSGGEAQRIKLATELARLDSGRTLYLLDEPTTGLHFDDIRRLLDVLHRLVDRGNTVIVIEHNLDVIKTADWLVDLGPEGGSGGGRIVAQGTPERVAQLDNNVTGMFLRSRLPSAQ